MWMDILPDLPLFYRTCQVGPTLLGKTALNLAVKGLVSFYEYIHLLTCVSPSVPSQFIRASESLTTTSPVTWKRTLTCKNENVKLCFLFE